MPFYYVKSLNSLDSYCFAVGRAHEIDKTISLVEEGRAVGNFSLYEKAFKNLYDAITAANAQGRIDPQVRQMHKKLEGMVEGLKKRVELASIRVKNGSIASQKIKQTQCGVRWAVCAGLGLGVTLIGLLRLKLNQLGSCNQVFQTFNPKLMLRSEGLLPAQDTKFEGSSEPVSNLQGAMVLFGTCSKSKASSIFPNKSVETSSLQIFPSARVLSTQIQLFARDEGSEEPSCQIHDSPGSLSVGPGGILQSMIDLDPTVSIVSVALSIALPIVSRLFLTSRLVRLDAAKISAMSRATHLDKVRLGVFRSGRIVVAKTLVERIPEQLRPFLFQVIELVEQGQLLLPDAIKVAVEKAEESSSTKSLLKVELLNSFVEATHMAIESPEHVKLLGEVEELELFAKTLSEEVWQAQELASSWSAIVLPALIGIMGSHLLNTLLFELH